MAVKAAKIIPHNVEAEQSVLACMLIDQDCSVNIVPKIKEDDFYLESHKNIYACMVNLYNQNKPIDFVTVMDGLEKNNILEDVGGIDYITLLTNTLPSSANYMAYVDIVKRDSMLRKLITAGSQIVEKSYGTQDKNEALGFAEKVIFDIAEKEEQSSLEHVAPALNAVVSKFDTIAKNHGEIRGISSGIRDFDEITNGLQNSDLILLAARPGVGKTSFAMNIVTTAAIAEKKKCAIFSLEMPKVQLAQRALCSVAKVSMEKALKGTLNMEDWKSIWVANKKLAEAQIYIDDSSMNTPSDLLLKCRKLKREKGLDLVMVDYLQLMSSTKGSADNRQQEVSEMTRQLKIAAKELNVPIILLSQLSRAVETRKDHRPILSDLRESGSIEQDADIVLFIYKPDMYNDVVSDDEPGVCELIVAKHRNGPTGIIKMRWVKEYTTFVDMNKKISLKPSSEMIRTVPDEAFGGIPETESEIKDFNLNEVSGLFTDDE